MMTKPIVFVFSLLGMINANVLTPRDLGDEAIEQIVDLHGIVEGQIRTAHDDLDNLMTDFRTNSLNVRQNGNILVQQEYGDVNRELNNIKELANAANAEISTCTNVREAVLNRIPGEYATRITICTDVIDAEAARITGDARYIIDIFINKVDQLEFQVRRCRGDLNCISPLMTEVELNKIRLPQNIKTEVQASDSLLTTLRLSVQSCSDDNVAEYSERSYSIINDILYCVNRIVDQAK